MLNSIIFWLQNKAHNLRMKLGQYLGFFHHDWTVGGEENAGEKGFREDQGPVPFHHLYTRLEQKPVTLEHYSEITSIILQTRHHKYTTLKEVKNSRSVYYCNIYHRIYLGATTATAEPEGTKYSWGPFELCKKSLIF